MGVDPCIQTPFNATPRKSEPLMISNPQNHNCCLLISNELVDRAPGTLLPSRSTEFGIAASGSVGTPTALRRYTVAERKTISSGASEGPCSGKATLGPTVCQEASVCLAQMENVHGPDNIDVQIYMCSELWNLEPRAGMEYGGCNFRSCSGPLISCLGLELHVELVIM